MLTLTSRARRVIRDLAAEVGDADFGLRISRVSEDDPQLAVTGQRAERSGDRVVRDAGATVYLDAEAASRLDDHVLDIDVDENRLLTFDLALKSEREAPQPV